MKQLTAGVLALSVLLAGVVRAADHADRIFVNGKVWTADDAQPLALAIAIQGDKILVVGSNADVRAVAGPDTAVVDLGGRLVVPGFHDSHAHFPGGPEAVELAGVETLREFQQRVVDFAKEHAGAGWIRGSGWGYSVFPNQKADKRYLDEVMPDRPVYLSERDGHMGLANSKALELSGITKDTSDPPNGHIERDATGEPTGELKEAAQRLLRDSSRVSPDDAYRAFLKHMDRAAASGLTSIQNASWSQDAQNIFLRALAANELKLRFRMAPMILPGAGGYPSEHKLTTFLTEKDLEPYKQLRQTFQGPLIEFGSIKGVLDGVVDAKTAAMMEPYVGGGSGLPFWEQDDLNRTVALYDREGFQVMLHAIGDKAVHMALDAFEYAAKTNGTSGKRHRVEHVEVPALSDLPRFKQLGVIASTQPMFANPDATTLENYAVVLGPERASHANAFKLFDDAGAVQAFGSDWGVFPFEPLPGLYVTVARMTPTGTPAGGWYPRNRISIEAALRHYTRDGAYAGFDEHVKGTLTAGKLADLVVLSEDILTGPPEKILNTKVLLTVMGGRDTYRDPAFR